MSQASVIELEKSTFYLNGLHCANCAAKIETAIHGDQSFQDVNFSFATKKLQLKSVMAGDILQLKIQGIVDAIEDGVVVDKVKHGSGDDCTTGSCAVGGMEDLSAVKQENVIWKLIKANWSMIIGAVIVFTLIFTKPVNTIALPAYVLAYVLIGGDVASGAIKHLLKGNLFDENFLMTLATFGAFAIGEYTEAVMVMLFYKIGEGFQDYAVDYSRRSIQSLLDIKAEYANLLIDGKTKMVSPESLHIDDVIMIKAGEKVPVDGSVLEGTSSVDTSALTGESLPRTIVAGDEILSGAINTSGVLKVKVARTYENSTVARILDMVENATGKKAKTEQFITKFARVYTPIVVVSAVMLAILPPILGFGGFREWLSRALIFLVISCPCALVLSVPLGYFAGLGKASRKGILIKGGNYLEALNGIDTFVFDKTGTLTKGNFAVQEVIGDQTLALAALLEEHSTHPIAKSILAAYGKGVKSEEVTRVEEKPGEGLVGIYNNAQLLVGNDKLMKRFRIPVKSKGFPGTIVHVAYDNNYIGEIHIADEIKPDVADLAKNLKGLGGKEVVMLTGDMDNIAAHVAEELELDGYYSELLPQDKLTHVEAYIEKGAKVLFVGDGINDAPVLARADIGVAMGGLGSDAAIEAADIVLMTDEPSKLVEAVGVARSTRRIVMQNIIFALGVKGFFLTLGAFGYATMYEAIFADVGVALIAVLNSMRILRK